MRKRFNITKVKVNDSKFVRERNSERTHIRYGFTTNHLPWEQDFDSVTLVGRGSQEMLRLIGEEGINELFAHDIHSSFLIKRYDLSDNATLQDLFDSIPQYSQIQIETEQIVNCSVYIKTFIIAKESNESKKALARGYISYLYGGY